MSIEQFVDKLRMVVKIIIRFVMTGKFQARS